MNEVLEVIAKRYSCRNFTAQMPTDEQLNAIADAAIQAPSGMNRQAWRVIIIKDQELIQEMDDEGMRILSEMEDKATYERFMSRGGTLFYHTPVMIMVPIEKGAELDCGILCENVALAAASLGIDSLICGMARLAFAEGKNEYFRNKLSFPDGYEFGISVLLGYAANPGAPHVPDRTKISFV